MESASYREIKPMSSFVQANSPKASLAALSYARVACSAAAYRLVPRIRVRSLDANLGGETLASPGRSRSRAAHSDSISTGLAHPLRTLRGCLNSFPALCEQDEIPRLPRESHL